MESQWTGLDALEPRMMMSVGPLYFTDHDGDRYSANLVGPGSMTVVQHDPDGDGRGAIESIALTGTTSDSRLLIRTGGTIDLQSITADSDIGFIFAPRATVRDVNLLDGSGLEGSINVNGDIRRLHVANIMADVDAVMIGAVRSGYLIRGSIEAHTIGEVRARSIEFLDLRALRTIGTMRTQLLRDSNIFAGVTPAETGLPDSEADFVIKDGSIGSVRVTGRSRLLVPHWIENSNIAAWHIGTFTGGYAQPENRGVQFGIAAHTIDLLDYRYEGGRVQVVHPESTGETFNDGDATVRIL
jgi:hypothetical protein